MRMGMGMGTLSESASPGRARNIDLGQGLCLGPCEVCRSVCLSVCLQEADKASTLPALVSCLTADLTCDEQNPPHKGCSFVLHSPTHAVTQSS